MSGTTDLWQVKDDRCGKRAGNQTQVKLKIRNELLPCEPFRAKISFFWVEYELVWMAEQTVNGLLLDPATA